MSVYRPFTSARGTEPDPASLLAALKAVDPTAGVQHTSGPDYIIKTAVALTAPQITAVQSAIDTAPAKDDAAIEVDQKVLRALAQGLWEAIPSPLLTKPQLRARIIAIWRTL